MLKKCYYQSLIDVGIIDVAHYTMNQNRMHCSGVDQATMIYTNDTEDRSHLL